MKKKASLLKLDVRCGDCLFHRTHYHKAYGKPCAQIGVQEVSEPCKRFFVNPFMIAFKGKDGEKLHETMLKLVSKVKLENAPALAAYFQQAVRFNRKMKKKFRAGQNVVFRVWSSDYISNYYSARIMSFDKTNVYIQGDSGFTATLLPQQVLTIEEAQEVFAKLREAGKIRDPNFQSYYRIPVALSKLKQVDYEPPTIDGLGFQDKKGKALKVRKKPIGAVNVFQVNGDDDLEEIDNGGAFSESGKANRTGSVKFVD